MTPLETAARAFIAAAAWNRAEATAGYDVHEWVHQRTEGERPGFDALVGLIKAGERRRYRGKPYRTVTLDELAYWTTWGGGVIINRRPAARAGWDDE